MDREQRRGSEFAGALPSFGGGAEATSAGTVASLFAAAVAQHQAGALADAERQYRQILALFPDHADSLHNLGLIALQHGNAAGAVDLIARAIAANGRVAEYHYNIALAFRSLNRMDDVAGHLQQAIEIRPNYALAHLNLGNVRREQGRLSDAVACYERAIALSPNAAVAYFNLGNIKSEQGRWDEAAASYRQTLRLDPNHAEAYAKLGAALLARGAAGEAIAHLEQALALDASLLGTYQDLGKAFLAAGDLESAIDTATRALAVSETAQSKAFFAQCIRSAQFAADNAQFRKLLLRALTEGWARPRELANVSLSLIKQNGVVGEALARVNAAWPARLSAAELFGATGLTALSRDQLLCALLECDPITDIGLERLLTTVRHAMLTAAGGDGASDESLLAFYCALARQCFVNEYVFALTDAEADEAQRLRTALETALAVGKSYPTLWPIAAAAYFPLHAIAGSDALLARSWPPCVDALLVAQITEPREERRIATALPALTGIDDEVSRLVRQQYEESPYPRWVKAGPPAQPAILFERSAHQVADVLIAGCGTGLSTVEFARQAPGARILAIDLSRASLSYARRMADSFNVANVEFAQADIMRLDGSDWKFDFIDVSGVLHHLADPWQGWRVLLSLLRPGGIMQVGLYSDLARRNVVAARALIAARGYRPVPQDIRRAREDIIACADPLVRSVTKWGDFFATNECRDLLFHVKEHRITLPEIKSFLAANGVSFAGFVPEPVILRAFAARFPDPAAVTDLDCWHAFETAMPDAFANMYLFWVRKPAAASNQTTAGPN